MPKRNFRNIEKCERYDEIVIKKESWLEEIYGGIHVRSIILPYDFPKMAIFSFANIVIFLPLHSADFTLNLDYIFFMIEQSVFC